MSDLPELLITGDIDMIEEAKNDVLDHELFTGILPPPWIKTISLREFAPVLPRW